MKNKIEGTINLIALLLVIAFTIMSCFVCFEFYFTSRIEIDGIAAGTESHAGDKTNNISAVFVLGILQTIFICLQKRIFAILSMVCSIFGVLVTVFEIVKCYAESAIKSMGGLGTTVFEITVVGYIVILLSLINMIVQIVSIKNKKEGNKQ